MPHTHPINDINDLGVVLGSIEYELVSASDREYAASPSIAFLSRDCKPLSLINRMSTLAHITSLEWIGIPRAQHSPIGTIRHKY
jgi:hypothetical protein